MNPNLSAENTSDVTWYLDSNEGAECNKDTPIDREPALQPWRSYWPPKGKETIDFWLGSEFPEILLWRFDRTQPFDRPWRMWARSSRALEEEHALRSSNQQLLAKTKRFSDSKDHEHLPVLLEQHSQQVESDIDDLADYLHLNNVTRASFSFLVPLDFYHTEKPYLSRLPSGTSLPRMNIVTENHDLSVIDVTGYERYFTLEKSGFQFAKCPAPTQQWTDSFVRSVYIPRIEEWLVHHLNCTSAFIYAYNFRGKSATHIESKSTKTPFLRAHCDATPTSCFKRLQLYFPNEAHNMMSGRVRFLNVWRNISPPNQDCDCPLALCDFRTIVPEHLVPADIIFPDYQDEAYEVLYNPNQRWFYKKQMDPDDVLLFTLGDNAPGVAPFCPHSAFMDPTVPVGTPDRVSIEVRSILVG